MKDDSKSKIEGDIHSPDESLMSGSVEFAQKDFTELLVGGLN
jgi:hypothetical protein